jgi:hypothetical protein
MTLSLFGDAPESKMTHVAHIRAKVRANVRAKSPRGCCSQKVPAENGTRGRGKACDHAYALIRDDFDAEWTKKMDEWSGL